jgi:hypothetical protein
MDEQERRETNEAEMDEQERRELNEADKQYAEARELYENTVSASKQAGSKRREEAEQRRAAEEAEQLTATAAQQFAEAVKASYQVVADRSVSAQELHTQLTQQFFANVINNLRSQAADSREMTQGLAEHTRRRQEAAQARTQESVGMYMEFMSSMFSYYQGGVGAAERSTRENKSRGQGVSGLMLEYYDSLSVDEVSERLDQMSDEEIERLRDHEAQNKNRQTLIKRLDARIKEGSSS